MFGFDGYVNREMQRRVEREIVNNPAKRLGFRPKSGGCFYAVNGHLHIVCELWTDSVSNLAFYAIGNCYATEKEAREIQKVLKFFFDSYQFGRS